MASKPFDASLKHLLEKHAADLAAYFRTTLALPGSGAVEVIDADVSTVTAAADKVHRIAGPPSWLLHLEVQTSHDHRLPDNVLRYNVVLGHRHRLPVCSVVLLLRPDADRESISGVVRQEFPAGAPYLEFRYRVVRLWQQPVEPLLTGGLGLLPLAPLADVPPDQIETVIERMKDRFQAEAPEAEGKELWVATYVLMGLQYPREVISHLLRGVRQMEDSVTYQEIVAKGLAQGMAQGMAQGKLQHARDSLLRLGSKRFGPPAASVREAVNRIDDPDRLDLLTDRVLDAASWDDLLGTLPSGR